MDFPTSDVEIRQILTEGEAFDDALIFFFWLYVLGCARFYKPRPCTETARRRSLPCCRTHQSAHLDGFPHFRC